MGTVNDSASDRLDAPPHVSRNGGYHGVGQVRSQSAQGAGTVVRVLRLMSAIAEAEGPVSVAEMASQLELSSSTVHRLLKLLVSEGFLMQEPATHRYRTAAELYRLASRVVHRVEVADLARPTMDGLAREFGEDVFLGMYLPAQCALAYGAFAQAGSGLRYRVDLHRPLPLLQEAGGLAILAHLTPEQRRILVGRAEQTYVERDPDLTEPVLEGMQDEFTRIKSLGYAVSGSSLASDARGVAAVVFGSSGVFGCLSVTAPRERLPDDSVARLGEALADASRRLSHSFGAR